jgi:hypothetical protein
MMTMPSITDRLRDPSCKTWIANDKLLNEAADTIEALCEALRALVPNNICDNPNVPDDCNFPCDITMGELRQAWAALAKAGVQ